jgi:hypothetical protein
MMTTSKRIKKAKEGKLLLLLLIHSTREKRKNNENTNKTKQIREREREREEEEVADVHTNNTNIHESVVISFGLEIRSRAHVLYSFIVKNTTLIILNKRPRYPTLLTSSSKLSRSRIRIRDKNTDIVIN